MIDRIKFDGLRNVDWLVYKYPGEAFVLGSQLIVGEGQLVIFVKGGQVLSVFDAGTYTLNTNNIPFLQRIVNAPFGGKTPFTAEVYYINRTTKLDMYWGTNDPISIIDPKYNIRLRIRARGQFGIRINDYSKFFVNIVGTIGAYEMCNFKEIQKYFRGVVNTRMKTIIAEILVKQSISALEVAMHLDELSEKGKQKIENEFEKFGISVVNFFIESINFPDEDFEMINKILADKAAFDIIGYNRYQVKRTFDVMDTAAANEGNPLASAGVGLGVGINVGGALGNSINNMKVEQSVATKSEGGAACQCGFINSEGLKFCGSCGRKLAEPKKICPKCKFENEPNLKFCGQCGCSLNDKICSNCSAKNDMNMRFCGECGNKLD